MELHQNELRSKLADLQAQKAQRDLNTAPTRQIDRGGNIVTQEQQPDGSYKDIATAPRWQPQQADKSFQFMSGPNGQLFRGNPRTGDIAPVTNADGTPFIGGGNRHA